MTELRELRGRSAAGGAGGAVPADRDRWADALRVGSLLVVVAGHWLVVVLTSGLHISNALSIVPSLQPLTWILQVMPLFFLVGGVANSFLLDSSARRGGTDRGRYAGFVRVRAVRLLRPTLVFLGVWVAFGVVAHLTGLTSDARGEWGRLVRDALVAVPQLLWFIGMYLGVCAFAPLMLRAHRRWGARVFAALALAAAAIDAIRFSAGSGLVGNLNFAFVWLALHQLGFAWHDGRLGRRVGWSLFVGGYAVMLACVVLGPYPTSMVGLPGEAVSNMAPPTFALLAQGVGISGLAAVLRPWMSVVLARRRPFVGVVVAGRFTMTVFLWHLTALMVVLLGLRAVGIVQPSVASLAWWLTRPLLFAVLVAVSAVFVVAFARFDHFDRGVPGARAVPAESRRWVDPAAAIAAFVIFFGILMVSIVGVDVLGNRPVFFILGDVTPAVGFAVLGAGLALLALARPRTTATPHPSKGQVRPPLTRRKAKSGHP